jgi:CCR4-NOT transcription complex subunit 3
MKLLQPEFFKRYDESIVFYLFSRLTRKQYWAGEELKRRDWKFHRKYETWFHRLGEPTQRTAEFEVAKCEFFDHPKKGWCPRAMTAFQFEANDLGEEPGCGFDMV